MGCTESSFCQKLHLKEPHKVEETSLQQDAGAARPRAAARCVPWRGSAGCEGNVRISRGFPGGSVLGQEPQLAFLWVWNAFLLLFWEGFLAVGGLGLGIFNILGTKLS